MLGSASHSWSTGRADRASVDQPVGLEHQRPDHAGDDLRQHERREEQEPQQRAARAGAALSISATPSANGSCTHSDSTMKMHVVPHRAA